MPENKIPCEKCVSCELAVHLWGMGSHELMCLKHDVMVGKTSRICTSFRRRTPSWLLKQERLVQV